MKDIRTGRKSRKRRGMITFEWILLISLLVIGIIGGLSEVRNALLGELQELANAITALNCDPSTTDCSSSSGWWTCSQCSPDTNP